jgi:hypothetical protein
MDWTGLDFLPFHGRAPCTSYLEVTRHTCRYRSACQLIFNLPKSSAIRLQPPRFVFHMHFKRVVASLPQAQVILHSVVQKLPKWLSEYSVRSILG